ncbi:glycosyltransferase family 4 protein [Candidatus Marinimicrobia bacterium]|nr:glycosyltransferase family 4 protein [Candidatus Neomarinimicrobiota bacterium]
MKFNHKTICYVSHYLIEHDELFLKSLCETGYKTHLVAFTEKDLPQNILSIPNLEIHYKKIPDIFNSRKYSYPFLVPKLKKIINNIKPDILHSGWTPKDGLMATLSGFHPHLSMPWGSEIMIHPYENYLYKLINNFVFNKCDHITCDSEHVKGLILKDYNINNDKVTVFPWGIDLNIFKNNFNQSKRSEFGWEDKTVLIMTRKFEKFYRIEGFIDIFNDCLKINNNLRLFLLGAGSLESKILSKIKDYNINEYIHTPGWINRNEMNNYLNSADIYISNSYTDGSSVSLLEAMACGLSPIVTKIESIEEWVDNDSNGYLIDIDKPELMKKYILELASSPLKLERFKNENLTIAKNRLDWNKNFDILQSIYLNILK